MNGVLNRQIRSLSAVATALLLSACAIGDQTFTMEELRLQAENDRVAMFEDTPPLAGPLTIEEAIERVLAYNLDARHKLMEEALAQGQVDLDRWEMIPDIVAKAGYKRRSKPDASNSRDIQTGDTTDAYTYSQDLGTWTTDLSLTWNVLDFGVSYFNARQNADRVLVARERRRKVIHNLVRETQIAFWRAAASQALRGKVKQGIREAESALRDIQNSREEGVRNPIEALRLRKTLLETLRQLEYLDQELATAKTQLAALINIPPGVDFRIALPNGRQIDIPRFAMPLSEMEEQAFLNNPDIREQGYKSRIAVQETSKAILRTLPGIELSAVLKHDDNSFLYHNRWWENGMLYTAVITNVLSAPARIGYAKATREVAQAKRLAIRMAVLAQVHVAKLQFDNARKQFRRTSELWSVERALERRNRGRFQSGEFSRTDLIVSQTSAIIADLRRYQAYAELQAALANVKATIGHDEAHVAGPETELPKWQDVRLSPATGKAKDDREMS